MIFRCMTNLKRNLTFRHLSVDAMESMNREILFVGRVGIIAMRHIEDILFNILLNDEPRTTAKT